MNKLQTVYIPTKVKDELPKITTTSIPEDKWGVHESHSCLEHGCKYGYKDCPVEIGLTKQKYPCEFCGDEFHPEMEKKEGYFFTPEELKQLLSDTFDASRKKHWIGGRNFGNDENMALDFDNAEEYIENFLNK